MTPKKKMKPNDKVEEKEEEEGPALAYGPLTRKDLTNLVLLILSTFARVMTSKTQDVLLQLGRTAMLFVSVMLSLLR